jgi:hypothetical protein
MEVTEIKCDLCGTVKGETNHWIDCITVPASDTDGIAFGPFGASVSDPLIKKEHLCGEACTTKRLSQWLAARK